MSKRITKTTAVIASIPVDDIITLNSIRALAASVSKNSSRFNVSIETKPSEADHSILDVIGHYEETYFS